MTPDQLSCIRYLMDEMDPSEKMAFEREVAQSSDLQIELESMKATYARLNKARLVDAPQHVQSHVEHLAFLQASKKRRTKGQAVWMRAAAIFAMAILPASYLAWQWEGSPTTDEQATMANQSERSSQSENGSASTPPNNSTSTSNLATQYPSGSTMNPSVDGWLNESSTIQMVNQAMSSNRMIPWQSTWSLAPAAASFATPDVHPSGSPVFDSLYQESYKKLRRVQSTPLTPSMNNAIQLVGAQRP